MPSIGPPLCRETPGSRTCRCSSSQFGFPLRADAQKKICPKKELLQTSLCIPRKLTHFCILTRMIPPLAILFKNYQWKRVNLLAFRWLVSFTGEKLFVWHTSFVTVGYICIYYTRIYVYVYTLHICWRIGKMFAVRYWFVSACEANIEILYCIIMFAPQRKFIFI